MGKATSAFASWPSPRSARWRWPHAAVSGSGAETAEAAVAAARCKGGTLTMLTPDEQLQHLDPQRIYTGEDAGVLAALRGSAR